MNHLNVVCKDCLKVGAEGEVLFDGDYIDSIVGDWHFSDANDAWFCGDCYKTRSADSLRNLLRMCAQSGVAVCDLQGNTIIPGGKQDELLPDQGDQAPS